MEIISTENGNNLQNKCWTENGNFCVRMDIFVLFPLSRGNENIRVNISSKNLTFSCENVLCDFFSCAKMSQKMCEKRSILEKSAISFEKCLLFFNSYDFLRVYQ